MSNDPKTIIGFKIKGGRRMHDVLWSISFVAFLLFVFLIFGYIQVSLCQESFPEKTWVECIRRK